MWAARYLKMNGRRRLLGSFVHGSMASALPQAIGAQAALPDRQVISLSGDGGVAMLLGDLLTLKQLKLPVKVVVFNNSSLGFVELEMKAGGWLAYGTEMVNPDFAKLAESAGMFGTRVEDPEDLQPALEAALRTRRSVRWWMWSSTARSFRCPPPSRGAGVGLQPVHDSCRSQRTR